MIFKFSKTEIEDLLISWLVISVVFAIVLGGGVFGFQKYFLERLFLSAITVGIAFLCHELAHKFVAQRYGFWAEFRKFEFGLIAALLFSFFGFVFAAPGAVMIFAPFSTREQNGKIALAGPLTNIVLGILCLMLSKIFPVFSFGAQINFFLALFNLFPFPPLDGIKVFLWSPLVWGVSIAIPLVIQFLF
jgi:Zn-dependent protease